MKISRKMFLATVASVCLTATVQAQSLREINFGIISTDSSTALKSMWQPFMDDMAKALKIDPLEMRLRNVLEEGSLSPTSQKLHSVVIKESLQQAAARFGWNGNVNGAEV